MTAERRVVLICDGCKATWSNSRGYATAQSVRHYADKLNGWISVHKRTGGRIPQVLDFCPRCKP